MVTNAKGLRPEKDYAGGGQQHIKRQTRPLAREGAPQKQDCNCQRVIYMGLDTKTYWLTNRQSQCDFDFNLTEKSVIAELWIKDTKPLWKGVVQSSVERTGSKLAVGQT
jgi:hypothetical protein